MNYLYLLLLCLVTYYKTINYGLIVDDEKRDTKARVMPWWDMLWNTLRASPHTFINIKLDHCINIALHYLVCSLVYKFTGSMVVAVLFCVHPVTTQVSVWLNGKRYACSTIIVLVMLLTMPWGAVLYPAMAYFQVSGALTPVLYSVSGYWWAVFMFPFFFSASRNTVLRQVTYRYKTFAKPKELRNTSNKKIVIAVKTFGYYTTICLFPFKLAFLHEFLESFNNNQKDTDYWYKVNWHFYRGLLYIVLFSVAIVTNWHNPIGKGLFWYCLFIAQWCNYPITINQMIAERYCYLPLIGLLQAVVYTVGLLPFSTAIYVCMFVYYYVILNFYLPSYCDIDSCINHNLEMFPDHYRIRAEKAERYRKVNEYKLMYEECEEGLIRRPNDFRLLVMSAHALIMIDRVANKEVIFSLLGKAESNFYLGQEKSSKRYVTTLYAMQKFGIPGTSDVTMPEGVSMPNTIKE